MDLPTPNINISGERFQQVAVWVILSGVTVSTLVLTVRRHTHSDVASTSSSTRLDDATRCDTTGTVVSAVSWLTCRARAGEADVMLYVDTNTTAHSKQFSLVFLSLNPATPRPPARRMRPSLSPSPSGVSRQPVVPPAQLSPHTHSPLASSSSDAAGPLAMIKPLPMY